jgi:hypothetical protein
VALSESAHQQNSTLMMSFSIDSTLYSPQVESLGLDYTLASNSSPDSTLAMTYTI